MIPPISQEEVVDLQAAWQRLEFHLVDSEFVHLTALCRVEEAVAVVVGVEPLVVVVAVAVAVVLVLVGGER